MCNRRTRNVSKLFSYSSMRRVKAKYHNVAPCGSRSLWDITSAMHTLLRASRAVWNARARVECVCACVLRVVGNFVVAYLELRRTLRYVQRPRDE